MNTMTETIPTVLDIQRQAQEQIKLWLPNTAWTFKWDRAKKRMGLCNYQRQTISLSLPIFELPANRMRAQDTILHEIAHALAGYAAGHGPIWAATARRIGAVPQRCGHVDAKPAASWLGACSAGCAAAHRRHRRPDPQGRWRCRRCAQPVTWHAASSWIGQSLARERTTC
jgi:predicted SprT family Zn-dependent metalloprotease